MIAEFADCAPQRHLFETWLQRLFQGIQRVQKKGGRVDLRSDKSQIYAACFFSAPWVEVPLSILEATVHLM